MLLKQGCCIADGLCSMMLLADSQLPIKPRSVWAWGTCMCYFPLFVLVKSSADSHVCGIAWTPIVLNLCLPSVSGMCKHLLNVRWLLFRGTVVFFLRATAEAHDFTVRSWAASWYAAFPNCGKFCIFKRHSAVQLVSDAATSPVAWDINPPSLCSFT